MAKKVTVSCLKLFQVRIWRLWCDSVIPMFVVSKVICATKPVPALRIIIFCCRRSPETDWILLDTVYGTENTGKGQNGVGAVHGAETQLVCVDTPVHGSELQCGLMFLSMVLKFSAFQ